MATRHRFNFGCGHSRNATNEEYETGLLALQYWSIKDFRHRNHKLHLCPTCRRRFEGIISKLSGSMSRRGVDREVTHVTTETVD